VELVGLNLLDPILAQVEFSQLLELLNEIGFGDFVV